MKDSLFLDICRNDYGAVFQMVRRAIEICPEELWDQRTDEPPFWQQAYHTLWAVDFYLSDSPESSKKASFVEGEATNLDHVSATTPSRQQIQDYLEEVSKKREMVLDKLTRDQLEGSNAFPWTGPTLAHRMIYNIRHAQHHVGRLNSILSRKAGKAAEWVIAPQ
jgi:AcrR family transcriptional regulator